MRDLPRLLGGKRRSRRSPALSLDDSPGKLRLIQRGLYYKPTRLPKYSLSLKARNLNKEPVCVRRYYEFNGVKSSAPYHDTVALLKSKPSTIYEVDGVASFTDVKEALLSAKSIGKQVLTVCNKL